MTRHEPNAFPANVYRFSSKECYTNSGMYVYQYRFYDPTLQRWLNRDPLEEEDGINLYQFVYNEPTDWVDPDGENATAVGFGIGVAAPEVPWWIPPVGAAVAGGAIGVGVGDWLNNHTPIGDIGTAIGNWICPINTDYKNDSGRPNIGKRSKSNTRKGAHDKAKKAGKGNKPVHHPNDPGQPPHFHPGDGKG